MNKLKDFREKKGISQRDIAKVMGLSQAQYWRLEKGISMLNESQIFELCHFYRCTPNDLLDFKSIYQNAMSDLDK